MEDPAGLGESLVRLPDGLLDRPDLLMGSADRPVVVLDDRPGLVVLQLDLGF